MFAIFLSEKMNPFYEIISSFPTVFFSVFLLLCIFYWCFAVLGMIEIDVFDFDTPDIDIALDADGEPLTDLSVMAGVLFKFGLNGVPISIIVSIISLLGWFFSFLVVYYIFPYVPGDILKVIAGIGVLLAVLYISAIITAYIIKPLRPIFLATNQDTQKVILGQTAVVRTGEVNKKFGEAFLEDGGAGLILKVRSYKDEVFKKNDRVVLLEYVKESNIYKVISEVDFKN